MSPREQDVERYKPVTDGDAPGHSHDVPGIWDSDNGPLAGKPCAWRALWRTFSALARGGV